MMTADPDVVEKDALISSWHSHHNNSIAKRSLNTIMDDGKKQSRSRRGIAMLTTLLALCVICLELQDYGYFNKSSPTSYNKEQLNNNIQRRLSNNGGADPPPSSDAISNQYIIKPYVGYSYNQIFESTSETKLELLSARASSRHNEGWGYGKYGALNSRASNAIDNDALDLLRQRRLRRVVAKYLPVTPANDPLVGVIAVAHHIEIALPKLQVYPIYY